MSLHPHVGNAFHEGGSGVVDAIKHRLRQHDQWGMTSALDIALSLAYLQLYHRGTIVQYVLRDYSS